MRLILITLLCLVTTACVGVGVIVPGERRFPELSPGTVRTPPSTREQVTTRPENRGRQPAVRHEGPLETWAYDRGASWCGALFVVVPLMLPVCDDRETYVFDGDRLVERRRYFARFHGLACSVFPVCPDGGNCSLCITE